MDKKIVQPAMKTISFKLYIIFHYKKYSSVKLFEISYILNNSFFFCILLLI